MNKLVLALVGAVLALVVPALPASAADTPTAPEISGSGRVGDTLTITSLGPLAGDSGGYTYAWLWDGDEDPGPGDTGASHVVTRDDVGKALSVLVKPADPDSDRLESNRIVAIEGALVAPAVTVSGTAAVKHTLTATFTSSGTPGANVTFSWTRDGVDIPGATGETYVLQPAEAGRRIAFRTTSTTEAGESLQQSTSPLRIPAFSSSRPTVSGTFKSGRTVRLRSVGTWYGAGYSFRTYRWLRNGSPIKGATASSYRLTSKDKGRRVSLRVTATKSGFASVAATSASTKVR
ncbi:hypothetical protein [Aeromicrobium stalagmiti]|uniref:hypothetical protein n=1 Tax=Aeromicrobium stalagmiti TaxID=2738988 RepID=UPI001568AD57|nr:hypothetical protein [Aeromicrobium stalagmiti]NRQ49826.1 hypothetical protein [Aeromicrobium stalagmiti]